MSETFQPAWWLPGPHLQTLWNPFFRKAPRLERRRERLWLADGDFIDLDWHGPHEATAPLVLVLHGLTGSSSSLYVLGLQQQLAAQGWGSVAINWRGCSGEPNLLPRAYHSGASDDLAEVIGHLQASRPMAPLHAVGYSLGGNVLLKYLGETGSSCPLRKAAALLEVPDTRLGRWDRAVLQAHLAPPDLDHLRVLMVDEKAIGRGHQYVTVVLDGDTGELLHLHEGRKKASLQAFFDRLTEAQKPVFKRCAWTGWGRMWSASRRRCRGHRSSTTSSISSSTSTTSWTRCDARSGTRPGGPTPPSGPN